MKEFSIGGIPIVDKSNSLLGIVTNRDLRFENDMNKPIEEVMTFKNIITGSPGITLKQAEKILQKNKIEKLPVVDKENKLVGLITFRDIQKITLKPSSNKDEFGPTNQNKNYFRSRYCKNVRRCNASKWPSS